MLITELMPQKENITVLVAGEILFDVFPEYQRIGGAPFNFAFHLKKLGFPVRFVSRVGTDERGKKILDFLETHGFPSEDIQVDPDRETGSVQVSMDSNGNHQFDIKANAAYDFIEFTGHVKKLAGENTGLMYFGTLIQRTAHGFQTLQRVIENKRNSAAAFVDMNLRPRCYTKSTIEASLLAADILKLNIEELEEIAGTADKEGFPDRAVRRIMADYSIRQVILTKAEKGSELFSGNGRFTDGPKTGIRIADTVGAGDAYAAVAAAGYLKGLAPERIISLAGFFADRICGIKGALPTTDDFYDQVKEEMGV